MDVRAIRTEADLDWALREVEQYFDHEPAPGTPEDERFEVLTTLIEAYEARHWEIGLPEAGDALRHYMELRGFTVAELGAVLGLGEDGAGRLIGGAAPSLEQTYALHAAWGMPLELLVQPRVAA